jgi:hypothetical protein
MTTPSRIFAPAILATWLISFQSICADSAIRWINEANQSAATVLNGGSVFTTTYRTSNDVSVTLLSGSTSGTYIDVYGGATPGNNPDYLRDFVGSTTEGTGDGQAGHHLFLTMSSASTGAIQFDFAQPLNSSDRILFSDVDYFEQYSLQAFAPGGAALDFSGWTYEAFSGQTGVLPDSRWPTWDPVNRLLTAGTSTLNEEVVVFTPDQSVSRLIITKLTGAGFSTGIQVTTVPEASSLTLTVVLIAISLWTFRAKFTRSTSC